MKSQKGKKYLCEFEMDRIEKSKLTSYSYSSSAIVTLLVFFIEVRHSLCLCKEIFESPCSRFGS